VISFCGKFLSLGNEKNGVPTCTKDFVSKKMPKFPRFQGIKKEIARIR
jgi:hypothetical protein